MNTEKYTKFIADVPDFPVKGVIFKDITPLLENPDAFAAAIEDMAELIKDIEFNKILSCDARGFLFGAPLAIKLKKPLVLARKIGKLPRGGIMASYSMEYGLNSLQVSENSLLPGDKVLIVDDILATGGSSSACKRVIAACEAKTTGICHLIELDPLHGREKLEEPGIKIVSCIHCDTY